MYETNTSYRLPLHRLRRSPEATIQERLTEVNHALDVSRSRWFVGVVPVNLAVNNRQAKPLWLDRPRRSVTAAVSLHGPRTMPSTRPRTADAQASFVISRKRYCRTAARSS
jgi:hypothetical protein